MDDLPENRTKKQGLIERFLRAKDTATFERSITLETKPFDKV
jgi:hypothetical protein